MSASIYLLSRAYPLVFMLPVLNIPIVNTFVVRIGCNMLEKVCIDLPIYAFKRAKTVLIGEKVESLPDPVCIMITNDEDFPDYENITVL